MQIPGPQIFELYKRALSRARLRVVQKRAKLLGYSHNPYEWQHAVLKLIVTGAPKPRIIKAKSPMKVAPISGPDIPNMTAFEIVDVLALSRATVRKKVTDIDASVVNLSNQGTSLHPIYIRMPL